MVRVPPAVILVTVLARWSAAYTVPVASTAMATGSAPVEPKGLGLPADVIVVIVFAVAFAV